jgi:quercetin dioxygenase-like cupin family protein
MSPQGSDGKDAAAQSFSAIQLDDAIAAARASAQWTSGDRVATSLIKRRGVSVTLLLLRAGARLAEHRAIGSLSLLVVHGTVNFSAAGVTHQLHRDMVGVLDAQVPHAVEAVEESALLLTVSLSASEAP